ncbi:helix-turn-helix transcriptional regulator [Listeria weihenstephanensis]|uniref:Helix-turn-helix transcriptional regulator n=1 Tax=Listeria weihenstephanensis TaxID=1006155 RepID=A0A1S7FUG0_9LIST|nr:helix-turn-helix transcriptional regulator [Listeria weihenstephanensis]AQY50975.1 XRE family transcriptional regulator [Listeria weihenstephanensis]MBC1499917.1 helix-turn-helix transcriptional regulator [Listeria weihenstephanensis]
MTAVVEKKINWAKVRSRRESLGISQAFISRKMGYKYSSGYSNLEKGMVRLSAEKAAVLADILHCKQEDFFK